MGKSLEIKNSERENQDKDILKDKLQKLLEQALEMEDYEAALYFSKEIKKIGKIWRCILTNCIMKNVVM